jgi:ammonium transporter, Amt family
MSEEDLLIGDDAVHGEDAYAFGDARRSLLRGDLGRVPINGDGELGVIHGENHGDNEISPVGSKKGDL